MRDGFFAPCVWFLATPPFSAPALLYAHNSCVVSITVIPNNPDLSRRGANCGVSILCAGCFSQKGHGTSLTAVETMLKIMKKMAENPSEDKFKRIRLGNAGFHSKVGGVDGGLEVRAEPSYVYPRSDPIRVVHAEIGSEAVFGVVLDCTVNKAKNSRRSLEVLGRRGLYFCYYFIPFISPSLSCAFLICLWKVMNAAGFEIDTSGEEPVLRHGSCDPVPLRLRYCCKLFYLYSSFL